MAVNGAAGTLFAWSVLLRPVAADLGTGPRALGSVFSLALAAFASAVLVGGRSVDRHGPRRGAAVAGVFSGTGLVVAATAPGPVLLHVGYGVGFGVGSGLAYLSAVTWASARSAGRRSLSTSLVVASYAVGPVLAAPLGAWAVQWWGWRPTLALAGLGIAVISLVASRALPGPPQPQRSGARSGPRPDGPALAALWLLFLAAAAPGLLAFAYASEIAREQGLSAEVAAFVVAAMAAGNLAGRLLAAPLMRRWETSVGLWADLGLMLTALAVLASPAPVGPVVVALVVLAVQYGLVSALLPGATWLVSGDTWFARAYGRVFSSFGVAGLAGPAVGALLPGDGYGGAFRALLVSAVVAAAALLVYLRRTPG